MLISKNIQIEFADSTIKAIDAIHDIREGVRSASLNLYSRCGKSKPNMSTMRQIKEFCERNGIDYAPLESSWLAFEKK